MIFWHLNHNQVNKKILKQFLKWLISFKIFFDLIIIVFNIQKHTLKYKIENQILTIKSYYKL